jgi:phosphatidylglycerol:prolipoprotein diacylglycerol transferase
MLKQGFSRLSRKISFAPLHLFVLFTQASSMLTHPQFNPIAFFIGPFDVRWYGLTYLFAFVCFIILGRLRARRRPEMGWDAQSVDDMLFYGIFGVIFGARLGEVLFFEPGHYFSNPSEILAVKKGGMSFHGGFLGVLVAMWFYGRRKGRGFWEIADFAAPMIPIGLAAGRIGNFINGELYGRPASEALPWAMRYPLVDELPRHPSQLYQATGEGLLLFILLWWFASRPRPPRMVSGFFLAGYAILRFIAEFFRNPDEGIFSGLGLGWTTAQWLCLPMFIVGIYLIARALVVRPDPG